MTQQPGRPPRTARPDDGAPPWRWPVDPTAYDRSPELRAGEAQALAAFVSQPRPARAWTGPIPAALERLFRPVADVLVLTGANAAARADALGIVAHELHRRQCTVWAWTAAEWLETLGPAQDQFQRRHRSGEGCRQHLMAVAYLVGGFAEWGALGLFDRFALAGKIFGPARVEASVTPVLEALARWGYSRPKIIRVRRVLCELMLANRSPDLAAIAPALLEERRADVANGYLRESFFAIARALHGLGLTDRPIKPAHPRIGRPDTPEPPGAAAPEWVRWCQRWRETATLRPETRVKYYRVLVRAGRWLRQAHPEVVSPAQWTRALAAEFVAAVDRLVVGQWAKPTWVPTRHAGAPLSARAKAHQLTVVRAFFRDCQEWDWIPRRFAPARSLAVPRSVQALIAPNPRVLAADAWAKLLWAGPNLAEADLPAAGRGNHYYPPAMVRALAVVWLFGGLRADEIRRLRVGCVRTAPHPDDAAGAGVASTPPAICLLEVPAHKTGPAFTKPVDQAIGDAILAWERTRPHQPASVDPKTGEAVEYLFAYRGRVVAKSYLNKRLIPLLCRKAGVPERDARGRITSHRARATIATQLFNAKEPLSLFELQAWLGHRTPASTQHYAKITPTKLARSYAAADYLQRNLRTVAVLIDQDAVTSGAAAAGAPWRFYDLGHGLCTYDFFDRCPHRMACAKCAFYRPKDSSYGLLLEGKSNLLRLQQDIPLTDDERAAVDDGLAALEKLCAQLTDVPTPAGPTPRQLCAGETSP